MAWISDKFLQKVSTLLWPIILLSGVGVGWILWAYLLFTSSLNAQVLLLLYGFWIWKDWDAGETESRSWKWVQKWTVWKYLTEYFPVKIVKTAELPPDQNYLFANFPHGIMCFGALCAFCLDYTNFSSIFPGIRQCFLTLATNLRCPFSREIMLAIGYRSSSAKCLRHIFTEEGKGNGVCLAVGGIQESIYSFPGVYKIHLKNRKGFVRIALETGTAIVPVITFNEPDLYGQFNTEGTFLGKVRNAIKYLTGNFPNFIKGRGLFQDFYGVIPRRHPLFVVVGEPIKVEKMESPTTEDVDALHSAFMEKLQELFNREKHKYLENSECELVIV